MSKLGRYSADRKKIEALSDDKTITVADCGTIFTLGSGSDGTSGRSGNYVLTLPTVADAGKGWWCKFILTATSGGDITVSGSSGDSNKVNVHVVGTAADSGTDTLGSTPIASKQALLFDVSAGAVNDTVEVLTDGSTWYAQAVLSASAGVIEA